MVTMVLTSRTGYKSRKVTVKKRVNALAKTIFEYPSSHIVLLEYLIH